MNTDFRDFELTGLIDLIPTPFLIQDGERVVYANRQSVMLYGYESLDDFIGTPIIDLIHPDDRQMFLARHERVMKGGEAALGVIEQRRLRADGSEIYVLSRGVRGTWRGQNCVLGIQIDITDRRNAELALSLAKERFGIVFDTATVGMMMLDLAGQCVVANATSALLLGAASSENLIGRKVDQIFVGTTTTAPCADIGSLLTAAMETENKLEVVDVTLRRQDGSPFDSAIRILPMYPEGRLYGFFIVFCDISERERIKEEVQRRDEEIRALHSELTRSSQRTAMGNLSSIIAHEISQPLSAIVNAAGALRRSAAAKDDGTPTDERLAFILEQADRASAIISGMRRLFQPDRQELKPEHIADVVADACAVAGVELNRRDISLDVTASEDLPPVLINRIQIQQVIYNLLKNAEEALSGTPGGRIDVRSFRSDDGDVVIRIEDNGPGIDPDLLPKLFEPFETSKTQGMGMGLYACRTIVEAHGGSITPITDLDLGTSFEIRLPTTARATPR